MGYENLSTTSEIKSYEIIKSSVEKLVPIQSEYEENSSNAIVATNFNQEKEEPPQNSDIHQLIREECGIKVCEEQKQNMEDTMLELLELMQSHPSYQLKNLSSMGYEHLSTIPETESNEVIESSVKNLVQIPSEYEVTSDDQSECDVPIKDESSQSFTTFSNPLFDCNDEFISSDDESLFNEDVSMENFKVYSNLLFDEEEINYDNIEPHYFNAESDLIKSLSKQDTLFDYSPKFDYLKEFSGELMPTSIINVERIKREHKEYISLIEKLLAINSFPRPLENFQANSIIETLPGKLRIS
nr:hypothetical protein [Tanacetum cinerariifolium]